MPILADLGDNEWVVAVTSVVTIGIFLVVWTLAHQWRRARVAAYNARLKQLMIERGMSADEVERVLEADANLDEAPKRKCGS